MRRDRRGWLLGVSCLCLTSWVLTACNNPGASSTSPFTTSTGGSSDLTPPVSALSTPFTVSESSLSPVIEGSGGTGGTAGTSASAGTGGSTITHSPSVYCGDAIVGSNEECDDGDEGEDGCTALCETRDQLAVPSPAVALPHSFSRVLGQGRHPLAGGESGFISVYVEPDGAVPVVGATVYNELGKATFRGVASAGSLVVTSANPVAAALPNGEFALAWTDFGGDGSDLGIALRKVTASGQLGPLLPANARTEFSQQDVDLVWATDRLIAAWVDTSNASTGPDIRVRSFDANLSPLSGETALAESDAGEADVALATFGAGWVAAYREGTSDGAENVIVKKGESVWRLGPLSGGFAGEKPALVQLDATHLLVAFTDMTDPWLSGVPNTPRLRYAVIDTETSATPEALGLREQGGYSSSELLLGQSSPALERGMDGVFLAWRTEAPPGDASSEQVWLKSLGWAPRGVGGELALLERDAELLVPRLCESSTGAQRAPALARTSLYPNGALALAWEDYSRSMGETSGGPDVVVHYAPDHPARPGPAAPEVVTEDWSGVTFDPWSPDWTFEYNPARTRLPNIYDGLGQFHAITGGAAITRAMLEQPLALNADVTLDVRVNQTAATVGIILRRTAEDPSSYFLARLSSMQNDPWRIQVVQAGVATDLATNAQPQNFGAELGGGVTYRLRFRAETQPDGSVFLSMKGWQLGKDEPAPWLVSATLPANSPLLGQLGSRPGRMGIEATASSHDFYFDDLRATYFATAGDLDAPRDDARLPLLRRDASYRHCRPGAPCESGGGCCTAATDCEAGQACLGTQGAFLGVGSHASVCAPAHCGNLLRDADEEFADAGGSECEPRACVPLVLSGQQGYCTGSCPCGIGDGDCIMDGHCLPGLTCGRDTAEQYNGIQGFDACLPPHCLNRVMDGDETVIDCGGSCGSNCYFSEENDGHWHCRVYHPCPVGHGDCDLDDECQPGLLCGLNKGAQFGLPAPRGVCMTPHCVNGVRDSVLGETSIDFGGPCSLPTGLSLSEFPELLYRKVRYALETRDFIALPTPTPPSGTVTTPVLKGYNRFIFTVPATADVSLTFNVGNTTAPSNPGVKMTAFNSVGATLKTQTIPSSFGNPSLATSVAIGRLGAGTYELDLAPSDAALSYSITRSPTVTLALRDGIDASAPVVAPLYFFVPAELQRGFLFGNFDPATPIHVYDQNDVEVTLLQVTSQIYSFDTQGKPGVWSTTFRTSSPRAHLVNLPDVFSFDRNAVVTSKIIRAALDYGTAPSTASTTRYLRYENRFLFHVSSPSVQSIFTFTLETAPNPPFEVRVQKLDGTHVGASPYVPVVGDNVIDAGFLPVGDYEFWIVNPPGSPRFRITLPAGVSFAAVDGYTVPNVWLASYREHFYVPPGTTSVRFGASIPSTYTVYNPSGVVQAAPAVLGNNVYEIVTPVSGTWAMNVQGTTHLRFLNVPQVLGLTPGITAVPLTGPPFTCTSNAECGASEVCGTDNGARFGRPATDDVCWSSTCASSPLGSCGSILHPCGTCPP